jgi:hypothetical protein
VVGTAPSRLRPILLRRDGGIFAADRVAAFLAAGPAILLADGSSVLMLTPS